MRGWRRPTGKKSAGNFAEVLRTVGGCGVEAVRKGQGGRHVGVVVSAQFGSSAWAA